MNRFCKMMRDEEGQILPWMVFMVVLFIAMAGLTLDVGHAFVCYRELQSSTDAAALAGAQAMGLSGATATSINDAVGGYSSLLNGGSFKSQGSAVSITQNGLNANSNLSNPTLTVNFGCSSSLANKGITCIAIPGVTSPSTANILQVTQATSIPTYFIKVLAFLGIKSANSINLSTASTASMLGAKSAEYNIAMIIDTTPSMGTQDNDAECKGAKIDHSLG